MPPNVPVEQYWSVTAYDRETHALIRNMTRASRASNSRGSAEECGRLRRRLFRPEGTGGQGGQLGTDRSQREFELLFRLYGPKKEFFDKVWVLPDVEIAAQ